MKAFFVLACICVVGSVPVPEADPQPAAYASDYGYALPANNPSSQYHAQDEVGAYTYGYNSAEQTKSEVKTADGVVRGSYSYIDANGIVQTVNYISDAMGFRVAATNLPVHHVEAPVAAVAAAVPVEAAPVTAAVEAAPVAVQAAVAAPVASASHVLTPSVPYAYLPYATNYGYHVTPTQYVQAPVVAAAAAPVVHAAPVAVTQAAPAVVAHAAPVAVAPAVDPVFSKYHAQDELGQYSFGYNDASSNRHETKTADGVVQGSYNYVDSNGHIQTVQYIADAAGFRVAGTNLPIHAATAPVDTPEVAAAKVEHAVAYSAIAADHALPVVEAAVPVVQVAAAPVVLAATAPVDTLEVAAAKVQHAAAYSAIAAEHAVIHAAAPVVQAAAPFVQAAPVVQAAVPVVQAAAPFVQAAPIVQAAAPFVQAAPVVQAAVPVVQAATPVVYNSAVPVAQSVAPVVHATAPVVQAAAPIVHAAAPVVVNAPAVADSQYHAQDEAGQYTYGYSDGNSVKQEVKTADGVVRGAYSYVDADGIIQSVNYIADALGFRVGATNLPVHIVDEAHAVAAAAPAAAPVAVAAAPVATVSDVAPVMAPQVDYSYLPYATNYGYYGAAGGVPVRYVETAPAVTVDADSYAIDAAPSVVAESSVVAAAPAVATAAAIPIVAAPAVDPNTQFHAQDEFGQYNYGYANPTQTKSEVKTADGVTRGSYSYIDANGIVQTVNYISDAMGFRVAATNLPVHHVEGEAVAPVVAAKYEGSSVLTPAVNYAHLPYAQGYDYTMPQASPAA